jgi:hypothetical protein
MTREVSWPEVLTIWETLIESFAFPEVPCMDAGDCTASFADDPDFADVEWICLDG